MAALRDALGEAGFEDVVTYVQSGNVVLSGSGDVAKKVRAVVKECAGVDCAVVVRTPKELASIVERNPFVDEDDPKKVHVVFLDAKPSGKAELDPDRSPGDEA